jgi:hypothetical protein
VGGAAMRGVLGWERRAASLGFDQGSAKRERRERKKP